MLAKTLTYTFVGGDTKQLPAGRFFRLISAPTAVDVEFFDQQGASLGKCEGVTTGFAMSFFPGDLGKQSSLVGFAKCEITSAAAQTVKAIVGRQPSEFNALSGTVDANLIKAATLVDSANQIIVDGAAAAVIAAADATRRSVVIHADAANAAPVHVGTAPDDTHGMPIDPGMSLTLDTSAAVKAFAPTGSGNQVVQVLEIKD